MERLTKIWYVLLLLPISGIAQTYSQRFEAALNQRDAVSQKQVLKDWQLDRPRDPDLQVAHFNYNKQRYEEESDSVARNEWYSKSLTHLETGIARFPDRLDMRFLKVAALGDIGRYEAYTETIVDALERDNINQSNWLWKNNAELVNASDFLLQYVDNFVVQLYNRQDESLHPYMDQIANRVLKSYPDHVPSLSNLAITALYHKQYDTGISHLTRALSIDPTNTSVLSNLAYAYEQVGNKEEAIKHYEAVAQYGDAQTKSYANKQLEKLRNDDN